MSDVNPKPGKGADPVNVTQFKDEIDFLISKHWTQKQIGELIGIKETNFSNYLRGKLPVTGDIISEFRFTFKKVLQNRAAAAPPNIETPAPGTGEPEFDYSENETTPDERIDAATQRLEAVVTRLENLSPWHQKPPESPPGDDTPPQ